jgi:membrane protein implicated in regulation of membrane protease activity
MDIAHATWWWVAAGLAVAIELATGTFYLLMIALGLASAALAAHLGLSSAMQLVVAAVVGSGATALWHWKRMQHPRSLPARENRDVNLDIGETVQVVEWAADRTARVIYRGTGWTARLQPGCTPSLGSHQVIAVEGNWLVVAPLPALEPVTARSESPSTTARSTS